MDCNTTHNISICDLWYVEHACTAKRLCSRKNWLWASKLWITAIVLPDKRQTTLPYVFCMRKSLSTWGWHNSGDDKCTLRSMSHRLICVSCGLSPVETAKGHFLGFIFREKILSPRSFLQYLDKMVKLAFYFAVTAGKPWFREQACFQNRLPEKSPCRLVCSLAGEDGTAPGLIVTGPSG